LKQKFASIISWVFLPLLTPIYALVVLLYLPVGGKDLYTEYNLAILNNSFKFPFLIVFFVFTFVAPSITVLMVYFRGGMKTLMMEKREERYIPAIMTNLYGVSLCYLLYQKISPEYPGYAQIISLAAGALITVFLCTLITFKWKISLHGAGMGILSGFCFALFTRVDYTAAIPVFFTITLLTGLVLSARMYLKAHSLAQLFAGFGLGFFVLICSVSYFFKLAS
jgi:membrane-associated phospholipid phosphatase